MAPGTRRGNPAQQGQAGRPGPGLFYDRYRQGRIEQERSEAKRGQELIRAWWHGKRFIHGGRS